MHSACGSVRLAFVVKDAHATQVASEVALVDEVGDDGLVDQVGMHVGAQVCGEEPVDEVAGRDDIAEPQARGTGPC